MLHNLNNALYKNKQTHHNEDYRGSSQIKLCKSLNTKYKWIKEKNMHDYLLDKHIDFFKFVLVWNKHLFLKGFTQHVT